MAAVRCILVVGDVIANTIIADPDTFSPPPGAALVVSDEGSVGDTYVDGAVVRHTPAPDVPQSVQMWQAKAVLASAGLLSAADAAVAAMNNHAVTSFWEDGGVLDRGNPVVEQVGAAIGLSSAQIDTLFVSAAATSV